MKKIKEDPLQEDGLLVIIVGDGVGARAAQQFAAKIPKEAKLVTIDPYYADKKYAKYRKKVREGLVGLPAEKVNLPKLLAGNPTHVILYANQAHTDMGAFLARLKKATKAKLYGICTTCHNRGFATRDKKATARPGGRGSHIYYRL